MYDGPNRRSMLQNGIGASEFEDMSPASQNWHMYSQIQTLACGIEDFIQDRHVPVENDVGLLKKFRVKILVGLGAGASFLLGLGILEHKAVFSFIKLLL